MNLMDRLLGHSPESAHIAKERLQLVLAHDRTHISPETLEILKDEIIGVISKHIDIDRAHVEVSISRSADGNRLVADIPVLTTRSARRAPHKSS
jgi:cell division topological specificity factor